MFWAYIGFAQYFLIWYGNVPEETQFYLLRRNGGWYTLSILLPILNFVVPFFLLLPRANKRNPFTLALASLASAVVFWLLSYVHTVIAALVALVVFLFLVFGGGGAWIGSRFGGGPGPRPRVR